MQRYVKHTHSVCSCVCVQCTYPFDENKMDETAVMKAAHKNAIYERE